MQENFLLGNPALAFTSLHITSMYIHQSSLLWEPCLCQLQRSLESNETEEGTHIQSTQLGSGRESNPDSVTRGFSVEELL